MDPTTQSRIEFLEANCRQLAQDQAQARSDGSWIAVRQLGQDLNTAHKELDALRALKPSHEPTAEEILAEQLDLIRDEVEGWPEEDVEVLYVACCERLKIPVVQATPEK